MQRIANLLICKDGQVLLLKKPRRNWYVAPGGKMEVGESILILLFENLQRKRMLYQFNPHLKGIYTMVIEENGEANR